MTIENNPQLAVEIMDKIYKSIVTYSNEIVNTKASEKKEFIDLRLNEVKNDLENYENQLLEFSEKNKDIDFSPRLMSKRIESKKIFLYINNYILLSSTNLSWQKLMKKIIHLHFFYWMSLVYILPRPGYR